MKLLRLLGRATGAYLTARRKPATCPPEGHDWPTSSALLIGPGWREFCRRCGRYRELQPDGTWRLLPAGAPPD